MQCSTQVKIGIQILNNEAIVREGAVKFFFWDVVMTFKFLEGTINPILGKIESKMSPTLGIPRPSPIRVLTKPSHA